MNRQEIESRTGLVWKRTRGGPPMFVHEATRQQFTMIPAGAFVMGMSAAELMLALRAVGYDPDIEFWRTAHRQTFERANPVRCMTVQTFLCGRSPLLGAAVATSGTGIPWSTHATAEHGGPTVAAAMTRSAADTLLAHFGWQLISDAQWEYVARCGGVDSFAGGTGFRAAVDELTHDPRFDGGGAHCNGWRIWGLALGEWVADSRDGFRGGGVLHAPWQDSDEAMSCHAAYRPAGKPDILTARPIVPLPWLEAEIEPVVTPESIDFATAVAEFEDEIRTAKARARQLEIERRERRANLARELPGSVQEGTIRSVGEDGVYIVRLANANGVLRVPDGTPSLRCGEVVTVRVICSGGVPEVALVAAARPPA